MGKSLITNSIWVYGQKFFTAAITLVSTPIILKNLGVEDFGIYSLTIGIVAVFNLMNWSLTAATQRFIAVAIGKNDEVELKMIFNNSFFIHLLYGLLLLVTIGMTGFLFVDRFLDIPPQRLETTKIVILFVSLITFFQMVSIPYQGVLKAYETFSFISIIGILDSIFKLIAALLLSISPIDKLMFFSFLMAGSAATVYIIILLYALKRYPFLRISTKLVDFNEIKVLFSFTSWNLIGAAAILGRNQGVGVILNIFFGVIANAAYGVALQVQAAIGIFSQGIITSISPRIMKSAGVKDYETMLYYASTASKFGIIAVAFIANPLFANMETVLTIWLGTPPKNAVEYAQLTIGIIYVTGFSIGIQTIFQGLNKVKEYNIWVSLIILLNIPIAILFFYWGYASYSILVICIILELIAFGMRLLLLNRHVMFSVPVYLRTITVETIFPVLASATATITVVYFFTNPYIQLILSSLTNFVLLSTIAYFFSLNKSEKNLLITTLGMLNAKNNINI